MLQDSVAESLEGLHRVPGIGVNALDEERHVLRLEVSVIGDVLVASEHSDVIGEENTLHMS